MKRLFAPVSAIIRFILQDSLKKELKADSGEFWLGIHNFGRENYYVNVDDSEYKGYFTQTAPMIGIVNCMFVLQSVGRERTDGF